MPISMYLDTDAYCNGKVFHVQSIMIDLFVLRELWLHALPTKSYLKVVVRG